MRRTTTTARPEIRACAPTRRRREVAPHARHSIVRRLHQKGTRKQSWGRIRLTSGKASLKTQSPIHALSFYNANPGPRPRKVAHHVPPYSGLRGNTEKRKASPLFLSLSPSRTRTRSRNKLHTNPQTPEGTYLIVPQLVEGQMGRVLAFDAVEQPRVRVPWRRHPLEERPATREASERFEDSGISIDGRIRYPCPHVVQPSDHVGRRRGVRLLVAGEGRVRGRRHHRHGALHVGDKRKVSASARASGLTRMSQKIMATI